MNTSKPSYQRKTLSQKNSRILLTTFFLFTVLLGYLSALGIKSASENEEFRNAMEELQQNSNPAFIDSTNIEAPEQDSIPRP